MEARWKLGGSAIFEADASKISPIISYAKGRDQNSPRLRSVSSPPDSSRILRRGGGLVKSLQGVALAWSGLLELEGRWCWLGQVIWNWKVQSLGSLLSPLSSGFSGTLACVQILTCNLSQSDSDWLRFISVFVLTKILPTIPAGAPKCNG